MKDNKSKPLRSSIREPRWQQILSIGIVLLIVIIELFIFIRYLHHAG